MNVNDVFLDVLDRVSPEMNGSLVVTKFNRFSRIAELRLIDWLSGNIAGNQGYPEPYTTQKSRDWLTPFIKSQSFQVENGSIEKPEEYYLWQRAAVIGDRRDEVCGEDVVISGADTPIELLDSAPFDSRSQTHIASLKPSATKPICKEVGEEILFLPKDLGSVILEFVQYPVFAELKFMVDPTFNNEVYDPVNSIDYMWKNYARQMLVYFICEQYPLSTREAAFVQQEQVVGKIAAP